MKTRSNAGTVGILKIRLSAREESGTLTPRENGLTGLDEWFSGLTRKERDFARLLSEGMRTGIIEIRQIRNGIEVQLKGGMPCLR